MNKAIWNANNAEWALKKAKRYIDKIRDRDYRALHLLIDGALENIESLKKELQANATQKS
jgi:ppGpp synthetase/RelA/SpoT-type nucleotidyltranferase